MFRGFHCYSGILYFMYIKEVEVMVEHVPDIGLNLFINIINIYKYPERKGNCKSIVKNIQNPIPLFST